MGLSVSRSGRHKHGRGMGSWGRRKILELTDGKPHFPDLSGQHFHVFKSASGVRRYEVRRKEDFSAPLCCDIPAFFQKIRQALGPALVHQPQDFRLGVFGSNLHGAGNVMVSAAVSAARGWRSSSSIRRPEETCTCVTPWTRETFSSSSRKAFSSTRR